MPIVVIYNWTTARSPISFRSKLRAYVGSGPDDGRIDIDDTNKATIDDFHLQFHARWQKYRYDESDSALLISGASDKVGGDYSLRITPTIERPEEV